MPDDKQGGSTDRTERWDPPGDAGTPKPAAATASTSPDGRFAAGQVIQDRYRVIERLGRGSMGEVYRAEDLRLHQQVALKFLTHASAHDQDSRASLLNEIRTARRVTHPNVCRVHDLGEVDGQPFVSMEYVAGEDLDALLRRIGRLPTEKATQMARQICAAVQAAHEQGVLHRDLKPANVLVDARGDVRITDFGIAAAVGRDGVSGGEGAAGSPAYMAPELFTGTPASVASDVYAIGLVLYEMFTGERLFNADSMTNLLKLHRLPVTPPSHVTGAIDHQIDAVILACLQKDPNRRPPSALSVLAQLPGADPIADAIAAGQTPSPALLAAAMGRGISMTRSWWIAGAALVLFALAAALDHQVKLIGRMQFETSEDVLLHSARDHADALLGSHRAGAEAHGFEAHREALEAIEETAPDEADWRTHLEAPRNLLAGFWYRSATERMTLVPANVKGQVQWDDPAHAQPGMIRLELDTDGRLESFSRIPGRDGTAASAPPPAGAEASVPPTDADLLERAGLAIESFAEADPRLIPQSFADERTAWQGPGPNGEILRVEIARYAGYPVSFQIVDDNPLGRRAQQTKAASWRFPARVALLVAAGLLAWGALRSKRADARGAFRIGLTTFTLVVSFTVLTGDHGGSWIGVGVLALTGMSHGLAVAVELATYYLAFEPYARRAWPETLISWSRLLSGRFNDPYVAGSILVGALVGCFCAVFSTLRFLIPRWAGAPEPHPLVGRDFDLQVLDGTTNAIGMLFELAVDVTRESMMVFVALVVLRKLLRYHTLAAIAAIVAWTLNWHISGPATDGVELASWAVTVVMVTTVIWSSIRFGMLALVAGYLVFAVLHTFPIRPVLGSWYAAVTIMPGVFCAMLIGGSLWVIARQPTSAQRAKALSATTRDSG